MKEKLNKLKFVKIRKCLCQRHFVKRMKAATWEKIFAKHVSDKGLIPKISKDLLKLENKKGFPGGAVVKNLPANARDTGSSPGPGRSHMPWSN